jgi:hypothetical protein
MSTPVTAGNQVQVEEALRKVCGVFSVSPNFLLSYVGPDRLRAEELSKFIRPEDLALTDKSPFLPQRALPINCKPPKWMTEPVSTVFEKMDQDKSDPRCPQVAWTLPELCGGRRDCRTPLPMLEALLAPCTTDAKACANNTKLIEQRILAVLPVMRPVRELQKEDQTPVAKAAAEPTPFDARFQSNLLLLEAEGGVVTAADQRVWTLTNGTLRVLKKGEQLALGQVLYVREKARFAIESEAGKYQTPKLGMEAPLLLDPQSKQEPAWIVVITGKGAEKFAPVPPKDLALDYPDKKPSATPNTRANWAEFGEAGHWYKRP